MDRLHMLVGNLSATDERDPQDARGWQLGVNVEGAFPI